MMRIDLGWKKERTIPSLPEVYRSLPVPSKGSWLRKFLAFVGPGYLVAVGYMDPGNWATDIAGGSSYGYSLLFVILISNLMAILLQTLAGKLGIVCGRDLAQACRDHYSKPVSFFLWGLCELAIAACDLAELIGTAIALQLLFHIPLLIGVLLTAVDVILILLLQNKGFRYIESIVVSFMVVIFLCFAVEMALAHPSLHGIANGFVPSSQIIKNPDMLYIAIGILGATVMPHNLYLHSSIVQTRAIPETAKGKKAAIRFATIDTTFALFFALFINAAILILSAASFHSFGTVVDDISKAYQLLSPILGTSIASILFGVALLASGQNSTLTGTLAGQIVMEGFLDLRLKPWLRRLITRLIAIIPAVIMIALYGAKGAMNLLILSQVILSLQLPFAIVPLIQFTGDREKMGKFANPPCLQILAWIVAALIIAFNLFLLVQVFQSFWK
ncbi:MAG: Nramp family divalent metal transporter [Thermoactinomyces sp.]